MIKLKNKIKFLGWCLLCFFCLSGCGPEGKNYFQIACVYKTQGRFGEAYNALKTALRLRPDYPEARKMREELKQLLTVSSDKTSALTRDRWPDYPDLILETYIKQTLKGIPEFEKQYSALMPDYDRGEEKLLSEKIFPLTVVLEQDVIGVIFITLEDYRHLLEGVSWLHKDYLCYQNPYLVSGILLGMKGYFQEALEEFQNALRLDPKNAKAHNNSGVTYFKMGNFERAVEHFQNALELEPANIFSHTNMGLTYLKLNKPARAEKQLKQSLQIEPDNPLVHFFLGYTYYVRNDFSHAARFYRDAVEFNPSFAQAYYGLGSVMVKEGDLKRAIDYFEKALGLRKNYLDAYVSLGAAYNQNRMFEKAEEVLRKALELEPDLAAAYYNLACTFALRNKKRAALYNLEKALEKGFPDLELIHEDKDLQNIRGEPAFRELLQRHPV